MASYKLNNDYTPILGDYIYFTEVPNIFKVEESVGGSHATLKLIFEDNFNAEVSADSQYYITLYGETISNVMQADKAINKRFFIQGDGESTANSVANALRNCSSLAAEWDIYQTWNSIFLRAKEIGVKFSGQYRNTNIPTEYLRFEATDGSSSSSLYSSKIGIDVFEGKTNDVNNYVTHLEKNFYGSECAFDISPVLATIGEYGKTKPFDLVISMTAKEGWWDELRNISGYTAIGYSANGSEPYLPITDGIVLQHNMVNSKPMIRYVYGSTIPLSYLTPPSTSTWNVTITYLDSAFNIINETTISDQSYSQTNLIQDREYYITYYPNTYYIDLTLGEDTVRYNVIKPLKATEYFQRILWRNEYNGVSFFDFTGPRTETVSIKPTTYEKNVFDFYDTNDYERKKIYKNDDEKTVKLTSHLLDKDGIYIFNSLAKSKRVWTFLNGRKYYVIPQSIEVNESNEYNNIYTANMTYIYSDNDTRL